MSRRDESERDDLEEHIAEREARSPAFAELVAAAQRRRHEGQLFEVRNISVSVRRPLEAVYDYVVDGNNLPRWASGLGHAVRFEQGAWLAEGPLGQVSVRFATENRFGVLGLPAHHRSKSSGQAIR